MVLCVGPPKLFLGPASILTMLADEDVALWAEEVSSPRPSWASLGELLLGQVTFSLVLTMLPTSFLLWCLALARGHLKGTKGRVCFSFGGKGSHPTSPP